LRRLKQSFDLEKARRICILWDATIDEDLKHISALIRRLTDTGKTVEVLAWVPDKTVPDRLTGLTYMRFLKKTDLNLTYVPVSEDARLFIETKYDLLIAISPSALFPLIYISKLSPAAMKVGPDTSEDSENSPYDLMIKTGQPFNTAYFIEQAMHYLALISNPETRA